jgi:hypothetical protein
MRLLITVPRPFWVLVVCSRMNCVDGPDFTLDARPQSTWECAVGLVVKRGRERLFLRTERSYMTSSADVWRWVLNPALNDRHRPQLSEETLSPTRQKDVPCFRIPKHPSERHSGAERIVWSNCRRQGVRCDRLGLRKERETSPDPSWCVRCDQLGGKRSLREHQLLSEESAKNHSRTDQ